MSFNKPIASDVTHSKSTLTVVKMRPQKKVRKKGARYLSVPAAFRVMLGGDFNKFPDYLAEGSV